MRRRARATAPSARATAVFPILVVLAILAAAAVPAGAAAAWSVATPGRGAAYGILADVWCASPTSCIAVGALDSSSTETRLIERWNGKSWTVMANPKPSGAKSSHLASVHCTSPASCFAVGQYETPAVTRTLIERWNGVKWSIVGSPNPPLSPVSALADVRCVSSVSCFAVGDWFAGDADSAAESTLVEHWDGAKWSIVPSPNEAEADGSGLAGVACTAATSCFAVGHYVTNVATHVLIEHWDGTKWSIVPSPKPPGANDAELSNVECPGATTCFAVGAGHGTLVERWNGTGWSVVTSPNPTGATGVSLFGLSCPSTTRCFAVSDLIHRNVVTRLMETWNGAKWSIVSTPAPKGTKSSSFSGVSCATTSTCFAVGEYRLGPSRRPLIERYQ